MSSDNLDQPVFKPYIFHVVIQQIKTKEFQQFIVLEQGKGVDRLH